MPAYVIVDIDIHDPEDYEYYKQLATPTIPEHDGHYIVRGGKVDILEGDWSPGRLVILEFPTVERAREWWSSETYSRAKVIRHRSASTKMIVVEGLM